MGGYGGDDKFLQEDSIDDGELDSVLFALAPLHQFFPFWISIFPYVGVHWYFVKQFVFSVMTTLVAPNCSLLQYFLDPQ